MNAGISKSPDSRYWRQLYRAALSEIDKSKLSDRIAEAERAVVLRARELFQAAGDNGEEPSRIPFSAFPHGAKGALTMTEASARELSG